MKILSAVLLAAALTAPAGAQPTPLVPPIPPTPSLDPSTPPSPPPAPGVSRPPRPVPPAPPPAPGGTSAVNPMAEQAIGATLMESIGREINLRARVLQLEAELKAAKPPAP